MNKSRPKWRISIRAALGMTLGLAAGMALIRAAFLSEGALMGLAGVAVLVSTCGAAVALVLGYSPVRGAVWAIVISITTATFGCAALVLFGELLRLVL